MRLGRGAGVVLALLGFACVVSVVGLLLLSAVVGREPVVAPRSTLVLRLSGDLGDGGPEDVFGQLLPVRHPPSVRTIVESIRKAKSDRRVSTLLVAPNGLTSPYWAKVQEIRDAITDFRRSGKRAEAFLEYGGQAEYVLATACDRITLLPASPLEFTGLSSDAIFLRGLLDKIGAEPDFVHIGDYKTATNQLTERGFTAAHREMEESLTRDLFDQLVRAVAASRKKTDQELRRLVDEAPLLPEEALKAGLVDSLGYEDEVGTRAGDSSQPRTVALDEYAKVSPASAGLGGGPRIAVIYVTGTITSGRSGIDPMFGPTAGSDTLVEYIRRARLDPAIRALVVRIDSPGGSAVASDVIWHELTQAVSAKNKKPLVASMSDLAASGGYYVAMAAPTIVAEPGTLTGSIGIYGGKIVTGGTLKKLGIGVEGVSEGAQAGMNSGARPYTPEERARLEQQLQAFYEQFVEKAAKSRGVTPERIDQVAQGRVWTGRQAKSLKLVDELGGLDRAIEIAKQRADIPASSAVTLVIYPPRRTLYDFITSQLGGGSMASRFGLLADVVRGRAAIGAAGPTSVFRRGEPLAWEPGLMR